MVAMLGGKSKAAPHIARYILNATPHRQSYLEPFIGGGAMFEQLAPEFRSVRAGDAHEDLMLMWRAAQAGWLPPDRINEDLYRWLQTQPATSLRGFSGFACSFGRKWFGGYARGGDRNYAAESRRALARCAPLLAGAELRHQSYDCWQVEPGTVVYCDPPYRGTTGYRGTPAFDSDAFWSRAEQWADNGAVVFVSEYSAPPSWREVWSKRQSMSLSGVGAVPNARTERLFTRGEP